MSQGSVQLWLEIVNTKAISTNDNDHGHKLWDITEKEPEEFEIRVCVFNAVGIPMMDAEGTSDVFFKATFDSKEDV